MSYSEVMKIGCDGMSAAEVQEEKERRIKAIVRLNLLAEKISCAEGDKMKVRRLKREAEKIKRAECGWLKFAAVFLY